MKRKDMYISQIANWYEDKGEKISKVSDELLFACQGFSLTHADVEIALNCVREMLKDLEV